MCVALLQVDVGGLAFNVMLGAAGASAASSVPASALPSARALGTPTPPGASTPSAKAPGSVNAKQVAVQLDSAEVVIVNCQQFEKNLAENSTLSMVNLKSHSILQAKVKSKLGPDFMRFYMWDYQGETGGATRGTLPK